MPIVLSTAGRVESQLSGIAGITTWPTAAAYANAVSLAEVLAYIQDGTRRGTGTILPANTSLYDVLKVPGADNTLNVNINEVIGQKTDAAAAGAVTSTDTLVGYVKQLVTEMAVVDEFHDVPAADNTLNAQINEVIGNKSDAAATGVVTATDTLVAYAKQLVTSGGGLLASHVKADVTAGTAWTTANSPVTIFTVTGDVLVQLFAVVTTNMTSTGATGTLEAGVLGSTASLLVQDAVDGTAFQAEDCWSLITAADNPVAAIADEWALVSSNITLTIATNNMATGGMTIYCRYIPISAGATVVTT